MYIYVGFSAIYIGIFLLPEKIKYKRIDVVAKMLIMYWCFLLE